MRSTVITGLALGGALIVLGCGGGAGPASPTFSPFGNDPSGSSSEPPGGSNETPPSSGGGPQTIAQLCTTDCAHIAAACPAAATPDCVSQCEGDATTYPNCTAQLQAFFQCIATATLTCSTYDGTTVEAPACTASEDAVANCISPGSTASGGAVVP